MRKNLTFDRKKIELILVIIFIGTVVQGTSYGDKNPGNLLIYWTDAGTDKIHSANIDGTNRKDLITSGLDHTESISLDVAGEKMYWTDANTRKIQRANLDGTNREDLVTGLHRPRGIALDVVGGKMYWTDWDTREILRANLNGSHISVLVASGLEYPEDIALDVVGGKMYWTDEGTHKIQRANLDGTNVEDLVTKQSADNIILDVVEGKMYWTGSRDRIDRANLDGTNRETFLTQLNNPGAIALDVVGRKMYWTAHWYDNVNSGPRNQIRCASLDKPNLVQILITGLENPRDIALCISPQTTRRFRYR